jgi:hypothetical protein
MMKVDENPSETTQRTAALWLQLRPMAVDDFHDQREVRCRRVEAFGVSTSAAIGRREAEEIPQCAAELHCLLVIAATEPSASFE